MTTPPSRREFLSGQVGLAVTAGLASLPFAAQAAEVAAPAPAATPAAPATSPIHVVYHVADGIEQAARAFANAFNHMKAEPNTRIVFVALGSGIEFLIEGTKDKNGNVFADGVAGLATLGVQFRACNNTLRGMKLDPSKLVLEARVVPSGVAEIARLQAREGYVYLRP
ncbi:MAG: DsrE family protein [Burkholderiales bacterium]|nr:DsrE family protein [Burkholderiales bacterium]